MPYIICYSGRERSALSLADKILIKRFFFTTHTRGKGNIMRSLKFKDNCIHQRQILNKPVEGSSSPLCIFLSSSHFSCCNFLSVQLDGIVSSFSAGSEYNLTLRI